MLAFLFHDLISLDSVDEADETLSTCCTIPANDGIDQLRIIISQH